MFSCNLHDESWAPRLNPKIALVRRRGFVDKSHKAGYSTDSPLNKGQDIMSRTVARTSITLIISIALVLSNEA